MDSRYVNDLICKIWLNENKLNLWQDTELAVIEAKRNLGLLAPKICEDIVSALTANPISIDWWLAREKEIHHDLNAFLDERLRFLPIQLQPYFHEGLTSYDTEEPAFATMISDSIKILGEMFGSLCDAIIYLAKRYRYTIMNGRTPRTRG